MQIFAMESDILSSPDNEVWQVFVDSYCLPKTFGSKDEANAFIESLKMKIIEKFFEPKSIEETESELSDLTKELEKTIKPKKP